MIKLTLSTVLAALLSFSPVVADTGQKGFSAADLIEAGRLAKVPPGTAEARARFARMEVIRAAFVLEEPKAWKILHVDERLALQSAFGTKTDRTDVEAAWLMRGATTVVSPANHAALSGFYNPIANVWLLLRWSQVGGAARIVDAALVPGANIEPASTSSEWTTTTGAYGDALMAGQVNAIAAFAGAHDAEGLFDQPAEQRSKALAQIDQWLGSLAYWMKDLGGGAAWRNLSKTLTAESNSLPPAVKSMPVVVRNSLTPVAVAARNGGLTMLASSPMYPSLIVTFDYSGQGLSGSPKLGLIDLRQTTPAYRDRLGGAR